MSNASNSLRAKACRICGSGLKLPQADSEALCDSEQCRVAAMKQWEAAQRERTAMRQHAVAAGELAAMLAARGQSPQNAPFLVVVATSELPLKSIADERRQKFSDYVHGVAAQGASLAVVASSSGDDVVSAAITAACATCEGHCCRSGGDTGYIDSDTFERALQRHPGFSRDELAEAYISAIPAIGVEGSCVFHGESGCTLSRHFRSRVCNDYICSPLREWLFESFPQAPGAAAVVIVDTERVLRSTLVDAQ